MKKEDKEILLKDLCARLPYGVKGKIEADSVVPNRYDIDGFPIEKTFDVNVELQRIDISTSEIFVSTFDNDEALGTYIEESQTEGEPWTIEEFKPYLRPMSSMTEEEKKEFSSLINKVEERCINAYGKSGYTLAFIKVNDWLNAHHFDYRGLIEKGLALEAPDNIYIYNII